VPAVAGARRPHRIERLLVSSTPVSREIDAQKQFYSLEK